MKDYIVEEVRNHRMEHTKKFNGNIASICENLREVQKKSGHKIIRLEPKRLDSSVNAELNLNT